MTCSALPLRHALLPQCPSLPQRRGGGTKATKESPHTHHPAGRTVTWGRGPDQRWWGGSRGPPSLRLPLTALTDHRCKPPPGRRSGLRAGAGAGQCEASEGTRNRGTEAHATSSGCPPFLRAESNLSFLFLELPPAPPSPRLPYSLPSASGILYPWSTGTPSFLVSLAPHPGSGPWGILAIS